MQIYLVGGAVRDQLLHLPVQEWDWVVVGATPEQMLEQKYQLIGKDFPVFLHPITKEEYALARTERKVGSGYKGFECYAAPDVTLEQDLLRRDLTINAMAQDSDGNIIDPFAGKVDLAEGVLRHVSPAFSEDPVRVLRLARFAARFAYLGFSVAKETEELAQQMAASGELAHLVPERVWQEFQGALTERHPRAFFDTLYNCGSLKAVFPEISSTYTEDNMQTLQNAVKLSSDPRVRFASLLQFMHPDIVELRCKHFHIPNDYSELAILAAKYRQLYQSCQTATTEELLGLLNGVDVWRRPERFASLLTAWQANVLLERAEELTEFLVHVKNSASKVDIQELVKTSDVGGKTLRDAIMKERLEAISNDRRSR